jgi:ribosome-associated protein
MLGEADADGNIHPVGNISCDSKESFLEISKNIMSMDHRRFKAECERAVEMGIQLIVLIEECPPFGRIDLWEVPRWRTSNQFHRYGDPMTLVDPRALKKAMMTMEDRYGVKFRFCTRRQSPARVIKYLKGEYK